MNVHIERLHDSHDCETCGVSYADGANVYFSGKLVLTMTPRAHCFEGRDYSDLEILKAILSKLGHYVSISYAC